MAFKMKGAPYKSATGSKAARAAAKAAKSAEVASKGDAMNVGYEEDVNDLLAYNSPAYDVEREYQQGEVDKVLEARSERERKARLSKGSGKAGPYER